jgi:hypothetical protein
MFPTQTSYKLYWNLNCCGNNTQTFPLRGLFQHRLILKLVYNELDAELVYCTLHTEFAKFLLFSLYDDTMICV